MVFIFDLFFSDLNILTNDYELAIRASKKLEALLKQHFNAQGKGLHELISSIEKKNYFSDHTIRTMRRLATIRNKLIHDDNYNKIEDKAKFIEDFKIAKREIENLVNSNNKTCVIM